MKPIKLILCVLLALTLLPAAAWSQTCEPATLVECNQTYNGDNSSGSNDFGDPGYPNDCTGGRAYGPEQFFRLNLATDALITVILTPDPFFDAVLAVLPSTGTDCDDSACIDGSDNYTDPEVVEFAGTGGESYYIVADAWTDGINSPNSGPFSLEIRCENCADEDGDGAYAIDADCFSGTDCCDSGSESAIGCDATNAPDMFPEADEICGDGIDQNCDGLDPTCPYCDPDSNVITCDSSVTGPAAVASTQLLNDYDCLLYAEPGPEVAYTFTATHDGDVRIRLTSDTADLALAVIPASGHCEGPACIAGADRVFGPGTESLLVTLETAQDYFIVVDTWDMALGDYSLIIDCAGCADDDGDGHADIFCGGDDCDDGDSDRFPGQTETCNEIDDDCDGLTDEGFALESDPSYCGDCYTACGVDELCDLGTCNTECTGTREDCGGACVDVTVSAQHCGACDQPCVGPHALFLCVDSSCVVDVCDAGWKSCDENTLGCETHTNEDEANCGNCGVVCSDYANGVPECRVGHCTLGACDEGYGNCDNAISNGCEAVLASNNDHCGICGNECDADRVCVLGECSDTCPDGQEVCNGSCMDVSADPRNCGGCGRVCSFPNASEPGCADGGCVLGECDSGWGNCDDYDVNGCEEALGTPEHCRDCDHVCEYNFAQGICDTVAGACSMGACLPGHTDCNESDIDGCEINTGADEEHCGDCVTECGRLESCLNGICIVTCDDLDDDGFADATCGGDDCDDANRDNHPGAQELCDGWDNNCDGATDEGFDLDADGFFVCGEVLDCCDAGDENAMGCSETTAASMYPGAVEECGDGVDQDCNGADLECNCPDADHDGADDATCGGDDCDDSDPTVHPDAVETCNEVDDDCDGYTDEGVCDQGGEGCGCATGTNSASPFFLLLLGLLLGLGRRRRA